VGAQEIDCGFSAPTQELLSVHLKSAPLLQNNYIRTFGWTKKNHSSTLLLGLDSEKHRKSMIKPKLPPTPTEKIFLWLWPCTSKPTNTRIYWRIINPIVGWGLYILQLPTSL